METYAYPQNKSELTNKWYESPMGIFSVEIEDTSLNPTIYAPADISTNTDPGTCAAVVNIPDASHSTDSNLSWSLSGNTSGSGDGQVGTRTFNLGTTTITYTATDANGNTSQDSTILTVTDNEDPEITLGNPVSRTTDAGQCTASVAIPDATFSDNCTGSSISWSLRGET